MTGNVGLWIDHRQAVIVNIKESGETTPGGLPRRVNR